MYTGRYSFMGVLHKHTVCVMDVQCLTAVCVCSVRVHQLRSALDAQTHTNTTGAFCLSIYICYISHYYTHITADGPKSSAAAFLLMFLSVPELICTNLKSKAAPMPL